MDQYARGKRGHAKDASHKESFDKLYVLSGFVVEVGVHWRGPTRKPPGCLYSWGSTAAGFVITPGCPLGVCIPRGVMRRPTLPPLGMNYSQRCNDGSSAIALGGVYSLECTKRDDVVFNVGALRAGTWGPCTSTARPAWLKGKKPDRLGITHRCPAPNIWRDRCAFSLAR